MFYLGSSNIYYSCNSCPLTIKVSSNRLPWLIVIRFYASCERIFNPKLLGKPIVVLSNNDGCIITRSNEAKQLGIKMGEPYFKAKKIIKENNVYVFSSNYSLYGDISERVMETLLRFSPDVEIYSIDEAFLSFKGFKISELRAYCLHIQNIIKQWVGIPVSIGVSSTKTLSKAANHLAKKNPELEGVCILNDSKKIDEALKRIEIGDVWGIGKRLSKFLRSQGIKTAKQFEDLDRRWVRKKYGCSRGKNSNGTERNFLFKFRIIAKYKKKLLCISIFQPTY